MAKLPGTQRARRRARQLLQAQPIKPNVWLVTGGELGHGVTVDGDTYTCDCGKQDQAKDKMCSHCLAVWLELNA